MEIKFTIDPDTDADTYRELYTADVVMEDGTSFTVRATEDDVSYDQFRADIFEDLFRSLAEATGVNVSVEEEDYASPFDEDFIGLSGPLEDYVADPDDINGC
jgi:hypothetical protein